MEIMANKPFQVLQAAKRAEELTMSLNAKAQEDEQILEVEEEVVEPAPAPDFEHKFKTLEGMFKAQNRRHAEEVQGYQEEITSLKSEVTNLRTDLRNIQKASSSQFTDEELGITQEMIEGFDEHSINLVRQATSVTAKNMIAKLQAQMDEEIAPLKEQLSKVSQPTVLSEEDFFDALGEKVPDWRTINDDPAFLQWLGEEDEITGVIRNDHLQAAAAKRDVKQTAKIFNVYTKSLPKKKTPSPQPVSVPSGEPSGSKAPTNLTAADYKQFKSEVARGRWKNRPKDKKRMEELFDSAIQAGTLRR
jgi:hypothetical protein